MDLKAVLIRTSGPSVENLLDLPRTAAAGGNNEEAFRCCARVRELDGRNIEAWLGKANSAGWQSTLANIWLS